MKLHLPVLLALVALTCLLMPYSFADDAEDLTTPANLSGTITLVPGVDVVDPAWVEAHPVNPLSDSGAPWYDGLIAGAFLSFMGVAVTALKAFKQSARYQNMSLKQQIAADILALAVRLAWTRAGRSVKAKARAENRKLNHAERSDLRRIAENEARMMAKNQGVEDLEVFTKPSRFEAAIDLEVERQKRPTMRSARGGTA